MLLVSPRVDAPRMEPHIPGPIKRKVDDDSSPTSTTMPEASFPSDSKRLCLDDVTLSMGQGANPVSCTDMQQSPFPTSHSASSMGVAGHGMLLDNNHMSGSSIGSPFQVPPNNEVAQKGPLGGHFDEKGGSMHGVDQELQDLLEELTKLPDPSPNELDLDNILEKDPLSGPCHPQPPVSSTPKASPQTPQFDSHVPNKDFSQGSPQMRPSSAGASYLVPNQSKNIGSPVSSNNAPNKSQAQSMLQGAMPSMPGTNWHAQQLKQLAASKQGPTAKPQASSWPAMSSQGLSPPYQQGSSPHHQPFSPQNVMVSGMSSSSVPGSSIQSPQNSLLSSITSGNNPPSGPSPPYGSEKLSSPVLNQQPFSPPNPILTNISGGSIKSPQNSLVTTNTRPSPPYRPEKLSSPALHQQPFSPQGTMMPSTASTSSSASMQGALYKPMSATQAKNMGMMMQQPSNNMQPSLMNESDLGSQDQFSFNNTKPLSHFSSEPAAPQKMPSLPAGSRQTLLHYLQSPGPVPPPPPQAAPPQQPQQVNSSQVMQQQLQQMMHPAPVQRRVQPSPTQPRQEQTSAIIARLQEPLEIPPAVPASSLVNGCNIRNHLLKQQIMRRQQQQQLQEKQRHGMMGVASEQRGHFVGQLMNQFPAVSQPMPADCTQSMPTPPSNHRLMSSPQAMLQSALGSGITQVSPVNQNTGAVVMIAHSPNKQPGMYPPNAEFSLPIRQSQNSLAMSSGCQTVHGHPTVRPGMVLASFASGSLANHTSQQQHLRQPTMPRMANVYSTSAQMWSPRMPNQSQMDANMQQFSGNAVFSKQNARPNLSGPSFTQSVAPPNQIAPGVHARQMQKASMGQSGQNLGPLNNQNLRPNLTRVPLQAAMNVMKPMPQGVTSFNQLSAAHPVGPPTYPGSAGQSSGSFSRMSTASEMQPQYDFLVQQNDAILSDNCSEADFIDNLMKNSGGGSGSSDEEWLNNLTMIDDILGQQSSGHV
ncbi:mastermind-like domain-containing protein 1 isoform X1 [Zootoca vivipara]|uniref:mastermind-like domain-containing protein 1 isoform X1 n=1 Tax=Zootoca vivipara TaxID=8524 RepID=UPI00293BB3A2|nr:mastermind-like domain-containing protein 1 isoform X1 [Zootoca vivipara]